MGHNQVAVDHLKAGDVIQLDTELVVRRVRQRSSYVELILVDLTDDTRTRRTWEFPRGYLVQRKSAQGD